ncbi:MAG: OmcA/MtrC family decaheme c-type cytochrome [Candidatus Hydrogenedentes bacterium]|nr:OmcA/MtrC family decaheme c-type cytochrome [Candidatus Hydrogenedentota bacterium]
MITINSVKIPADLRAEVIFTATDERGDILALNEMSDVRFILGYLEAPGLGSTLRYVSYITRLDAGATQGTTDSARLNGLTQRKDGKFKYKFATAVPAGYDPSASHQVAGQFTRLFGADQVTYPANAWFAFVPDGATPLETRDIVDTETCNTCHTRLEFHGGNRREIQYCIMCHNPQSTDGQSGTALDMPDMIHKIHMGEELPSVLDGEPYQIVGFGDEVHDYSDVVFPQDIRNCEVCHGEEKALFYLENPTKAGCASCHDRTWFGDPDATPVGWEDHGGGQVFVELPDDSLCATCHTPTEPGLSPIMEAHITPFESEDTTGLKFEITDVTILNPATAPQPVIDFMCTDAEGNPFTDLNTKLSSCNALLAWPAPEYEDYVNETVRNSGNLVNNGGGSYTYTCTKTFTPGSTDTIAVAMQGRYSFTWSGDGASYTQGPTDNGQYLFRVDGGTPEERREVVDEQACNVCHGEIRAHGGQRFGVNLCVMCHNPNETDEARRPVGEMPPVTVNFKDMLHKIHTGEDLDGACTIYGFSGSVDFSEVRFPAARQACVVCHAEDTYLLLPPEEALPEEALSTVVTQAGNPVSETLPITAACVTCHDGLAANVHAYINTAQGVETCSVCHAEEAEFAISEVHAMTP